MSPPFGLGMIFERSAIVEDPSVVVEEQIAGAEQELRAEVGPVQRPVARKSVSVSHDALGHERLTPLFPSA